jgi:hypothetical protein
MGLPLFCLPLDGTTHSVCLSRWSLWASLRRTPVRAPRGEAES